MSVNIDMGPLTDDSGPYASPKACYDCQNEGHSRLSNRGPRHPSSFPILAFQPLGSLLQVVATSLLDATRLRQECSHYDRRFTWMLNSQAQNPCNLSRTLLNLCNNSGPQNTEKSFSKPWRDTRFFLLVQHGYIGNVYLNIRVQQYGLRKLHSCCPYRSVDTGVGIPTRLIR
ncbi:hypothetical protein C8Q78DRAFT_987327 [Trametes maxima]|nr:hypothetical protein C8Q78DRAFT_987327 [Trametes maxima]